MSNNTIEFIKLLEEKMDAMFEALQEMIYKEGLRIDLKSICTEGTSILILGSYLLS